MRSHHHQPQWSVKLLLSGILCISLLTGCSVGTYNTDVTINGKRTIQQKSDGVKRKIETDAPISFENGTIAQFPPGAVLRIQETQEGKTTRAELHEQEGKQVLFIKAGQTLRASTPEEQAWFQTFLKAMDLEDRDKSDLALKNLRNAQPSFPEALTTELEELNSSEKAELLESAAKNLDLTPPDQVAIIDTTFDEVTFASSQTDILQTLIQRQDFAANAEQQVRNRIGEISFKSHQEEILEALNNRTNTGEKSAASRSDE